MSTVEMVATSLEEIVDQLRNGMLEVIDITQSQRFEKTPNDSGASTYVTTGEFSMTVHYRRKAS